MGLAWFLTDEAVGLALVPGVDATRTLLVSGTLFYVVWQLGTALGLLGASVEAVRSAAEAVFPVLFIGLAALTCASRSIAVRAVIAALATGGALLLWPGSRGVAAVVAAIAVAIPGRAE
jgi:predicted branched-subunit amino acid permease